MSLIVAALLVGATAWNVIGPAEPGDIGDEYVGRFGEGQFRGRKLDRDGARLAARWVTRKTRPTWNPLRILWHQLWYNAWTEDYDLELWLEPASGDLARRQFALYQSGRTVFLRIEFDGKNRVLDASFSSQELERALARHLVVAGPELTPEAPD